MLFHKYPHNQFIGNYIKGFAEIEKDQEPFEINFIINFSFFISEKIRSLFPQPCEEKEIINYIRSYIDENIFNPRKMARRFRSLLPNEGYSVDPYLCFLFAYEHKGANDIKQIGKIYGPLTTNIRINVTKQLFKQKNAPKMYNDFICEMLSKFDNMFSEIQEDHNSIIIFVPRDLHKVEETKKMKILNDIQPTMMIEEVEA